MRHSRSLFFSRVFFKKKGVPEEFEVEAYRHFRSFIILKLKGVNSITHAQEFIGEDIFAHEKDLHPLEKDGYYFHQIEGCAVFTKEGEAVGSVQDIWPVAGNDLLVVRSGDRELLIPFTQAICTEVDLRRKILVIDPPEGLLDLDEI
ncbi:MAG: ribosome maturation factor RimM [Candidatus Aminicenantes bacterium]